jgi:hypothetical protein
VFLEKWRPGSADAECALQFPTTPDQHAFRSNQAKEISGTVFEHHCFAQIMCFEKVSYGRSRLRRLNRDGPDGPKQIAENTGAGTAITSYVGESQQADKFFPAVRQNDTMI